MTKFPKDLLDALVSNEAAAVIGSGLSVSAGLPTWRGLLDLMISECEQHIVNFGEADELRTLIDQGLFPEVADECRSHLGKPLYRDFIQRIFHPLSIQPTPMHKQICKLPFSAILTTNYDTLLEQAYMESKKDYGVPPIYVQKNVAQLARLASEKRFFILKMHGHVDDIDTIVLTQHDYQEIIHQHPAYRAALSTLFSTRMLVFIGYGLRDPDLNIILSEQVEVFKGFGRRHFAFVAEPGTVLPKSFSEKYNITVIPYNSKDQHAELKVILSSLLRETNAHTKFAPEMRSLYPQIIPRSPYKFLDYYDVKDKDLFFGREEDTKIGLKLLLSHKLLILFGQSGVGKTSLLKAAIVPEILNRDYLVIYCRLSSQRIETIFDEFYRVLQIPPNRSSEDSKQTINYILDALKKSAKIPVIILDQFEQIFINYETSSFNAVGKLLESIINYEILQCHILLSIREDYFVRLNDLTRYVPTIFNNRFHITTLSTSAAELAIRGPAKVIGLLCEDAYVKSMLRDLDRGGIEPPQLQIVCTAVFDALPPENKEIDIGTYKKLGGAEKILSGYIGYVLNSFRDNDRDIAREILKSLVSPGHSRLLLNFQSLLGQLGTTYKEEQIKMILDTLVFQRLVRVLQNQEGAAYELSHDYLIPQIDQWISDEEREIRRIREVMERERSICSHLGTVIPLERARLLKLHVERAAFSQSDRELIEKSITDGESIEQQLRQLQEQLIQAQKMESVGALAGGIAHNFNNILISILGYSELLLEYSNLDNISEQRVKNIERSARKAGVMVSKLLSFARRDSHETIEIKLNEIINDSVKLIEGVLDKRIGLKVSLADNIPVIEGDSNQLEQVVMNLIVNARDAMPDGGLITIETNIVDSEKDRRQLPAYIIPGKYISLSISDTGCGIPEDVIDKIFEPFFTTKEKGKGTGLGLSTVYGIIKDHKGYINVVSKLNEGSTFEIFLPTATILSTNASEPELIAPLKDTRKVLIVDDDADVRGIVSSVLQAFGYETLMANDGRAALEKYKEAASEINIIIMDVIMPRVSGLDAAKMILELNPDAKILLTTGYDVSKIEVLWKKYCSLFLRKPFSRQELLLAIQKVLAL